MSAIPPGGRILSAECRVAMRHRSTSPAVSIVMPVRNAAGTLPEALASIASQTLQDWELLAVDDGSSDRSPAILAAASAADDRIRVMRSEQRGLVAALNAGIAASASELIARMDADDLMSPQRLELQRQWLDENPQHVLVSSMVRVFPEEELTDGLREYVRWLNGCHSEAEIADRRYVESPVAHPSVMFRRGAVVEIGGYRDGDFPEDYELWLRMLGAGLRFGKVPQVLLEWRESAGRTSRIDARYEREKFDRLRTHHLSRDPRLCSGREIVIWGAGRRTRRRLDPLLARGVEPLAWVDIDLRKIGGSVAGRAVVSPEWLIREPRPFVLVCVAAHGARELIAGKLHELGYAEGADWLAVG